MRPGFTGFQALLLVLIVLPMTAQVSDKIGSISPDEAIAGAPITIQVTLRQGGAIERLYLLHRAFGTNQFTPVLMDLYGNTARVTLPSSITVPPFVEYYFVLIDRSGKAEPYPFGETPDPLRTPPGVTLQLPVRTIDETDSQVTFLSPDPGGVLETEEVVISVSLLRADSLVVKRGTQIFLDGADVTSSAVFSGDLIILVPESAGKTLGPGPHRVGVRLYDRNGNMYRVASLSFFVKGDVQYTLSSPILPGLAYNLSVYGESRNESVSSTDTWYNRAGYSFTGTYGLWRVVSNGFLTSDERSDRQPQNRFYAGVEHPRVRVGYGDAYPLFPDLVLSGKRVRGGHAVARLGFVNLDASFGTTQRAVEGIVAEVFPAESLAARQAQNPGAVYGKVSDTQWGNVQYGTYTRDLFAVRPSFGSGETWQLGFSVMGSADDPSSIQYGIRPQENVVLGSDLLAKFDAGRIQFTAQGAFSAFNSDVSSGNITDERIGQLFPEDSAEVRKWRDRVSRFITVNEYLRPLSLTTAAPLAYDLALTLQYLNNVFQARYLFHGIDYTSFGATYVRRDVQGFSLTDRMRLIGNALYLNFGYERLQDNTIGTKAATTVYSTLSFAMSYYPTGGAPGVSAGYTLYRSLNPLALRGKDSLNAIDDMTHRIFLQSTYDVFWLMRHTLGLRLSISDRSDQTVRKLDVSNFAVGLSLASRYDIPLETTIDASVNLNTLPTGATTGVSSTLNYTSLAFQGKYEVLRDVLTCSILFGPTFGELERIVVDFSADWYVLRSLVITLEYGHFRNFDIPSEALFSLRGRYEL